MFECPFCHSPEVKVISHNWFTNEVVIHCLHCDEIAVTEEGASEDASENLDSDEPSADHA